MRGLGFGSSRVVAIASCVALAACAPQPTPIGVTLGNQASRGEIGGLPTGDYACWIQDGGHDYPRFRCVVRRDGHRTVLEKIEGSVRFRGVVVATAAGFGFDGELYCPWGDCTQRVRAEFRPRGGGVHVATFQPADARRDRMTITLEPSRGHGGDGYGGYGYGGYGGYGGDGYGGDGYGGDGYGGSDYGGDGYGGAIAH